MLRAAIDKCRDTGQFVASDLIDLSKIGLYPRVLQTFMPVYRDFRTVHTVADRRTHLDGLLVGLCQLDDLVNCALNYASGPQGIDLALFDESSPAGRRLLYFHPSRTREGPDAAADEPGGTGARRASITRPRWSLAAAGGRWCVRPRRISSPPGQTGDRGPSWRSDCW